MNEPVATGLHAGTYPLHFGHAEFPAALISMYPDKRITRFDSQVSFSIGGPLTIQSGSDE